MCVYEKAKAGSYAANSPCGQGREYTLMRIELTLIKSVRVSCRGNRKERWQKQLKWHALYDICQLDSQKKFSEAIR